MTGEPDHYDQLYDRVDDAFGAEADALLRAHAGLLDPALPVLDVGAGQGRNALYLARRGLVVHAIDPSAVAVEQLAAAARAEGLSLAATTTGFEKFRSSRPAGAPAPPKFEPAVERYGAVLLFGLLQILSREQIEELKEKLSEWTAPGSLLFVTSFTRNDPGFGVSQVVRTYLEPGELPRLFDGWSVVFFEEGWGPEHDHGDGELHRHHLARAVLRR